MVTLTKDVLLLSHGKAVPQPENKLGDIKNETHHPINNYNRIISIIHTPNCRSSTRRNNP